MASVDYDRSADTPTSSLHSEEGEDDRRSVPLEEGSELELTGRAFYDNERPPHHGE